MIEKVDPTDAEACQGKAIRVMVVDDHPIIREGIASILQLKENIVCVGEAADGREALTAFRILQPDIVLMDLSMPGMGGLEAIQALRAETPDAKIIVLTTYAGDAQARQALAAGAMGYILKTAVRHDLLRVIEDVYAGRRYISPKLAQELAMRVTDIPLSGRETEILQAVARGLANKLVADELGLSQDTIKGHLKTIFAKLDVSDRTEAVTVALRRGIINL